MKKIISVFICVLLAASFSSCLRKESKEETTTAAEEFATDENSTSEGFYDNRSIISDELLTKADEICRAYGAIGVQAAVIRDGQLYFTYEYGIADKNGSKKVNEDTKFRIASLSKLVTDIIFMCLCEKGITELHGDISDMLGFRVRNPYYPDAVITPAMLMSHTASIIDSEAFLSSRLNGSSVPIENLLSGYSAFSSHKPGEAYSYSNFSVALIGAICEKATDKPFSVLADELLFNPLGIDAGYVASDIEEKDNIAVLYGNGGYSLNQQLNEAFHKELGQTHHLVQGNLTISAKDYITILALLACDGEINGTKILSEKSIEEILTPRYDSGAWQSCFGLVRQEDVLGGRTLYTHTGSNFGMFSSFAFDAVNKNGAVVLSSGASGSKNSSSDLYSICHDLIDAFMKDASEYLTNE